MEAAIETIAPDDAHCARQSLPGMLLIIWPFSPISDAGMVSSAAAGPKLRLISMT